ncbi:uncharacterized protein OCT59_019053 [Rhizophagus irregularis]|uniref:RING-type domain-containing protein n=1 Tax=Rhizophagus irregularis (strain DAOM 197198w) TaxID=1432141 RepID=A0A015K6A0_RHIIW|nr:hypothetical protein RirG_025180 [Rhizophagus irregularis DAOM 197198w]UZO26840.1 hypothetical protein OCT59_019053 [Rhizophagus irregularis]GBC34070.1 hypothetical protein GLOIN_2v1476533 [Rhizophagus irregularis DAOM 181602=DAOM 197198]
MSNNNNTRICEFDSNECNGRIYKVGDKVSIPETNIGLISCEMFLCMFHYNKFILNENHRLQKMLQVCSHPKHQIYLNQSNKQTNSSLINIPKRLINVLGLDEKSKICDRCRKNTDKDPEYLQTEEYQAPIPIKSNNQDNITKIGTHTYALRNDILYTQAELKQLELDYQEIISQISIPYEVSLSEKIKKMSNILYKNQHQLNQKPIYNPIVFKEMLETADKDLIGFFDELYAGTNPNTKCDKTNENNKKKLVSLCYFLASINNKYINGLKADIGSYLQTAGASASSIDTLSNLGFSVTRKTVNQQKLLIANEHQETVDNYCLQNIEKMFFLNIDDYHNIHRRNQPTLIQTHNIFHFVTILLNSNPNILKISAYSSNNTSVHNPIGVDSKLIIKNFNEIFMNKLNSCYYEQNEIWKQFLIEDSYENRMELFTVHNYDGRIQNHQELRSMINSKLIDFVLHPLHSTKDYIECANLLFKVFEKLKNNNEQDYLSDCIIPTICDWPGQVNIRRAITLRNNKGSESGIPLEILSLIPIIGPLHISLNSRETLFQTYHFFFEMLYHNLFGEKKVLSQKPKQTIINFILNLTFQGWKKICNVVINRFENSKDAEYRMMMDLLDNSIPLTLDIYAVLFRSGFFEGYLEGVVRIWVLFQRLRRHNYNKAPLIFLSDIFYWTSNNHPIIDILKNHLPIFNDYFVENFHSSIRNQTAESNSIQQIIQKAKIIDAERTNNLSFKEAFINLRNPTTFKTKLDYLEKKTSLFLLSLFDDIYHNMGNTQQINRNKYPNFSLPTFNINVDVKILPLAWNTQTKPSDNKFCDAEKCLLLLSNNSNLANNNNNIVLTCGHAYHKQCLDLLKGNCEYCFNYLSLNIEKNITSLKKRLFTPLKDNEKPLVEDEDNDSLSENNNDENIENILEVIESNIDNQFEILYQTWLNY